MNSSLPRRASTLAVALVLAGCAQLSPDGGFGAVEELALTHTGQRAAWQRTEADAARAQARVAELLAQSLTPESAVRIALLNNRALQARYGDLGVADAERVRASTLANPLLSFGRLSGGGALEIERAISFDILGLFTLPLASRIGEQQLQQAQWRAAMDTIAAAATARKAFTNAIAARQLAQYAAQVHDAAETASELARRMRAAGNLSALEAWREQVFAQQASAQLTRARHQELATRERLVRALGLTDAQGALDLAKRLPQRLPDLPAAPLTAQAADQAAVDRRLDVQLARQQVAASADALGLAHATGFINALDIGAQNKSASGEPTARGYEIELALPLFDFGGARNARTQALYMQAVHHTAAVAQQARSEVREAWSAYDSAWQLARLQQAEVVPLGQQISEEMVLRYNGMFASVFELLADARRQATAVMQAIEAQRDFWLADTDLQSALSMGLAQDAPTSSGTTTVEVEETGH